MKSSNIVLANQEKDTRTLLMSALICFSRCLHTIHQKQSKHNGTLRKHALGEMKSPNYHGGQHADTSARESRLAPKTNHAFETESEDACTKQEKG